MNKTISLPTDLSELSWDHSLLSIHEIVKEDIKVVHRPKKAGTKGSGKGRLGSLNEEKNSLSKKVRYLEETSKLLQDHVDSLQHKVNQVPTVPSVQIVNVTKDQDTVEDTREKMEQQNIVDEVASESDEVASESDEESIVILL
ncbi:Hypothetical predicted protein [Paramuricea clavata]|uniref:Uncharacterized protein n=1 Tax=Paramuricea clavata TaxID=317549 RepID=A0A7D9I342_PARCT|nr:Hypothetical predicted protein [Paramuricea clavata]